MTYDTMTHDELIATLHRRNVEIERLSLDLHDARNQLHAAWAQLEAIGAGGVDRRLHTGVAVPQEAPSDAEIIQMMVHRGWKHLDDEEKNDIVSFARALLARYGAQPAASVEPVAYLIDWPDEPELGHYIAEAPTDAGRCRALVLHDATPVAAQPQRSGSAGELPQVVLPPRPAPAYEAGDYPSNCEVSCDCYAGADVLAYGRACAAAQRAADSAALAHQASGQAQQDAEPDMYWDADDPEGFGSMDLHGAVEYMMDSYTISDLPMTLSLLCARSMPNVEVRVTGYTDDDGWQYEVIDAARKGAGGEK